MLLFSEALGFFKRVVSKFCNNVFHLTKPEDIPNYNEKIAIPKIKQLDTICYKLLASFIFLKKFKILLKVREKKG